MSESVKVLVVDDHPLVAQATKQLLEQIERVEVVGMAGTGQACLEFLENSQPDIVFLDYQLPDHPGTYVTEAIKSRFPNIHVVIFTGKDIGDLVNSFLELKVSGIISKESGETTILNAFRCLLDGQTAIPISMFQQMRMFNPRAAGETLLTAEELTIMNLIIGGDTHEQIATKIHMSKRSVDNYLKKIYEKLGVKSKAQAIEKFVQSKAGAESAWRE
ncbi:response regulator transcription factor [Paenibacillus contaminans]|jgi:two-component system competent response regulator ComA|uniref:DNA-binding response regulator n=1 Tax=Paenibacillus contaminans TaxID=450362 RepID=A0A329M6I1_9BACL|nr:response regulator transcription factor [Paenibacillus contaminans]RAV15531.1 DNA-binding response regulator [Paenibacillus contaminans]